MYGEKVFLSVAFGCIRWKYDEVAAAEKINQAHPYHVKLFVAHVRCEINGAHESYQAVVDY